MIEIDCDFPGGNIVVDRIGEDEVWLHQDLRHTEGWWFYWLCRIRGVAGREILFHFTGGNVLGACGPAVSKDFFNWRWADGEVAAEEDEPSNVRVKIRFPHGHDEYFLSHSIPYVGVHLDRFLAPRLRRPELEVSEFGRSEQDRPLEKIRVRAPAAVSPRKVILVARLHACESVANYVLEGVIDAALDHSTGFLALAELLVIPFMDKDGVENGDQGKNRRPHDHNRDYTDTPLYAATRALIEELDAWSGGELEVAIDVHCPWIRGGRNETVFFCEPPPPYQAEFHRFTSILAEIQSGGVGYDPVDNIGYGVEWNTGTTPTFCRYIREHTMSRLVASLEFPYSKTRGGAVTAERAHAFGRDIARALVRWMGG